jgi:hypothetical protein
VFPPFKQLIEPTPLTACRQFDLASLYKPPFKLSSKFPRFALDDPAEFSIPAASLSASDPTAGKRTKNDQTIEHSDFNKRKRNASPKRISEPRG